MAPILVDISGHDPERVGVCSSTHELGERCGAYGRCASGAFCASPSCPRATALWDLTGVGEEDREAICLPGVREGGICDSNLADAFVDPDTSGGPFPFGCAPCEHGTWCLPNSLTGIEGDPDEQRCVRPCTDDGQCGCNVSKCEPLSEEATHALTGESLGSTFCTPCFASNAERCDLAVPCGDDRAECAPARSSRVTLRSTAASTPWSTRATAAAMRTTAAAASGCAATGCGTITDAGVYTAPATPGECTVVARSERVGSARDEARVSVVAP